MLELGLVILFDVQETDFTNGGNITLDPYKDINFIETKALILGSDGGKIYENDVVFPDYFSENSINIVASKYFKKGENDIRQMINRVSNTITQWGENQNYFDDESDRDEFNYNLKRYQIGQYFAFNSPMYFNAGVTDKVQASACFILSIKDDMDSIASVVAKEARIFKKGSGSGMNLSTLRSKHENVGDSTGCASGPISFLKGHDIFANIIRSGGALRRSAKLACLNIDHPDIEDFLECKKYEEEKLNALRKANIKIKPGGELSDEVFFQNTNISVGIFDRFVKRVLKDGAWTTRYVTTGEIHKTYNARELFYKIAKNAWECADPGLLFLDTMNRWNTCSNDGLISSTNPCAEFVFLDDTSCNLASINLLKFFSKVDGKIVFDYELFVDVIKTVITAQDITVDAAVYPTDEIAVNSHKYRPLGLGYTNLGALLMTLGMSYDSNEGRALASSITALMTGVAYLQSGALADKLGAFERFDHNKEPFYKVLNMHQDHIRNTRLTNHLNKYVYETWDTINQRQEEFKDFRNAQVTLLAPTGCIVSESMILSDRGILEIGSLLPKEIQLTEGVIPEDLKWIDHNINILQEDCVQNSNKFYYNGYQDTIKILTDDGYEIEGTPIHKVRILDSNGNYIWKELQKIEERDQLCIKIGGHELLLENKEYLKLKISKNHICKNKENIDSLLKEDLAYLLGYYMGNGNLHKDGLRLIVGDNHTDIIKLLEICSKNAFDIGITTSFNGTGACKTFCINNLNILDFFKINNFEKDKGNNGEGAASAFIPKQILESRSSVLCAFLKGLFDSDGTINNPNGCPIIEYSSVSKKLIKQMQTCLTYLGIMTSIDEIIPKSGFTEDRRNIWRLRVKSGYYVKVYKDKIGFLSEKKNAKLDFVLKNVRGATIYGKEIWNDFRKYLPKGLGHKITTNFNARVTQEMGSLFWAQKMIKQYPSLTESKLGKFIELELNVSRIKTITKTKNQTFDISVPNNNTYIVNNIVSHNTISFLMGAQTTGVEPEFSHVKYKRLSNSDGSTIKCTSEVVSKSLANLGYTKEEIEEIECFITDNKPLKDCACLVEEDRSIFDISNSQYPEQMISANGHIKMMAAVQPFISGAISKTINLPSDCSVEDIFKCYLECWKLGLKGVTVYRDGSKSYQPLSTSDKEEVDEDIDDLTIGDLKKDKDSAKVIRQMYAMLAEQKLPPERPAVIHKFSIGGLKGYLTCGLYADDGGLGEIFINMSKEGSTLSGLLDCLATITSISLQRGVPLKDIVEKMIWQTFEPAGITNNPEIRIATSIVDYIFKYIGINYLNKEDLLELGLVKKEETVTNSFESNQEKEEAIESNIRRSLNNSFGGSGKMCSRCGGMTIRKGMCDVCLNCGENGSCG